MPVAVGIQVSFSSVYVSIISAALQNSDSLRRRLLVVWGRFLDLWKMLRFCSRNFCTPRLCDIIWILRLRRCNVQKLVNFRRSVVGSPATCSKSSRAAHCENEQCTIPCEYVLCTIRIRCMFLLWSLSGCETLLYSNDPLFRCMQDWTLLTFSRFCCSVRHRYRCLAVSQVHQRARTLVVRNTQVHVAVIWLPTGVSMLCGRKYAWD